VNILISMRVAGSMMVIIAYFIILHLSAPVGVAVHFIADLISVPYFIKTKSYDVVVMLVFLLIIGLSKLWF